MADADVEDQTGDEPETDDGVFELARKQYGDICSAQQEERAQSLQDRRFVSIAGAQWEGDWEQQFANSLMVEHNKTAQGVEKIIADYRANRMTVNFRAVSDNPADEETSDTLDGLFLADVYISKGQQAFDGAFEEAVQGGMGAWRLRNKYVDEYDPDNDHQRIGFEWIPDADQSVFFDMDARLYDKSDAKFCFVVTAMSPAAYTAKYDDDPASWPDDILKTYYDWYTPEVVRAAEYYRKIEETEDRLTFEHTVTGETKKLWRSEIEVGGIKDLQIQGWRQMGRKPVKRCRVEKLTFSAAGEIAPRQTIAGTEIPIVPVYGKRWFIQNMERVRGHVRLAKDPQRSYNAQISKLMEIASLSPIERPIFTPDQMAGHTESWAQANINRAPYALINPILDANGNPMPAGPIGKIEPPQLPPVLAALVQITANDIAELTTNQDHADETKSNVSAEAMDIAATRTDAKSFTYMDNMRQSMQRCGEIYMSMAKEVYVEEGREVPTMDEEGQQSTATLGETKMNAQGATYVANDFNTVKLNVIADVTEATSTRRDKTVKTLLASAEAIAPIDPAAAAAMVNVAVSNMDGEGITDLKEWLRMRGIEAGYIKPTDQEKEQIQQLQAQQGNQQPDPQAQALQATAQKEQALAVKAGAQTELAKAQAIKALAEAHGTHAETHASAQTAGVEAAQKTEAHRVSMIEKLGKFFGAQAKAASGE